MQIEKDMIESMGFMSWDRKEFQKFVQALEIYAISDYENISKHMGGSKTPVEVRDYAVVFFAKVDQLNDAEKIKNRINKAQQNVHFNMRAPGIIKKKLASCNDPWEDISLPFATQKSKYFSKESDVILIILTDKLGYGNWTEIKRAIRRETRCKMDHLVTSRNEEEIKKRVIYLVQCLEKEQEERVVVSNARNTAREAELDA